MSFTYNLQVEYPPIYLNGVDLDLTLDYLPITILYCPPDQDMLNSVEQSTNYATVVTLGNGSGAGSFYHTTTGLSGGVQISAGGTPEEPVPINVSVSGGSQTQTVISSSQNSGTTSTFNFSYSWNTLLTVDNQSVVGRSYWGPLGDLFLLLKGPVWNVKQSTDGTFVLNPVPDEGAEIVIVPGHKLLNPEGDPIASAISPATRRKLLELDPFYTNLGPFFPAPSPNVELSAAVDPYVDPSTGSDTTNLGGGATDAGDNRACLIATYMLDNGASLDLTTQHKILFTDTNANQSTYHAEVIDETSVGAKVALGFLDGGGTNQTAIGELLSVSYQESFETRNEAIKTAHCRLVRNQVEQDQDAIQVWYDKLFSTFMFRRVHQAGRKLKGIVYTPVYTYRLREPVTHNERAEQPPLRSQREQYPAVKRAVTAGSKPKAWSSIPREISRSR